MLVRDFCTPSFHFLCVKKKSPDFEIGRQEERKGVHYTLVNELPVRHPEKRCHANAS